MLTDLFMTLQMLEAGEAPPTEAAVMFLRLGSVGVRCGLCGADPG